MKTHFILFFFFVCTTSYCQTNAPIKTGTTTPTEISKNSLKYFIDGMIKDIPKIKNAEVVTIIVNNIEVKDPENYNFDILDMREMSIIWNGNIENDEKRASFTINFKIDKE